MRLALLTLFGSLMQLLICAEAIWSERIQPWTCWIHHGFGLDYISKCTSATRRWRCARRAAAEQQRHGDRAGGRLPELPHHRRRARPVLLFGPAACRRDGADDGGGGPAVHAALLEPGPHDQQVRRQTSRVPRTWMLERGASCYHFAEGRHLLLPPGTRNACITE